MKTAIFHDYFGSIGGGEGVVKVLAELFNADVYTTDISVPSWFIKDISLNSIGNTIPIPGLKQTSALIRFFLEKVQPDYDLYICSGNWAHYAAFHHAPVIMYCQDAPVRALYDQYSAYLAEQNYLIRPFFASWSALLRKGDLKAVSRVHTIVANSKLVKERVQIYYKRDVPVIYPPIETKKYAYKPEEGFWLSVNRLYPDKQIDLQIDVFSQLPELKLYIVGGIGRGDHAIHYYKKISQMATHTPNVIILGEVSEEELISLYSRCTGLICTARNEAFGITPLEAMASGKPVIALNRGGYLETITSNCGRLVNPEVKEIVDAVREITIHSEEYRYNCIEHAKLFDIKLFHEKFIGIAKTVVGDDSENI